MPKTSISVIIPVFNGEQFIADTIYSVINQTVAADEIIIVDDESTDSTEKIVNSLSVNIRYIKQEHSGGPTRGRNLGVSLSSGNLIAFLDHDDLWPQNKLELQREILLKNKPVDIAVGKTQVFRFHTTGSHRVKELFEKPKFNLLLSASLINREAFDKIGQFDETLNFWGSDGDWFLRAREKKIGFVFHHETSLLWQYHTSNTSRYKTDRDLVLAEILKRSLDRRRNVNGSPFFYLPHFESYIESKAPPDITAINNQK